MPWFRVVADRFDWVKRRGRVVCHVPGVPYFGTTRCLEDGIAQGVVEEIDRPAGLRVGKDGKVYHE